MTARFLKDVNDAFDILNVRAFGAKAAGPLRVSSCEQREQLARIKKEVATWQVVHPTRNTRPPCFDGLIQDINVVLQMRESLVGNGPLQFLLTGRLNQDCIENFFAQIRARGGHRFNPSAKEFRYAYRILSSQLLLSTIPSSNCAGDNDIMLSSLASLSRETCRKRPAAVEEDEIPAKTPCFPLQVIEAADFEVGAAVENVLVYIGGYLVKKLQRSQAFSCQECMQVLVISDRDVVNDSQLYLHLKAYSHEKGAFGGLTAPSTELVNILKQVENIFGKNIRELLASKHVLKDLESHVYDQVVLTTLAVCPTHQYILKNLLSTYLRCRLHYFFRFETRQLLHERSGKRSRKAKAVLHE